jgi:HptB-dependent secretion and biofilm anti anti-sigma factor
MEINVRPASGGTTLELKGRFDFQAHQVFRRAVDDLIKTGNTKLTVDLADVNFIDSSALGMLLLARETCEKAGGGVTLERPQDYVDKVLKLCHFDQLFQVQR